MTERSTFHLPLRRKGMTLALPFPLTSHVYIYIYAVERARILLATYILYPRCRTSSPLNVPNLSNRLWQCQSRASANHRDHRLLGSSVSRRRAISGRDPRALRRPIVLCLSWRHYQQRAGSFGPGIGAQSFKPSKPFRHQIHLRVPR